jgi:hypothetical protein
LFIITTQNPEFGRGYFAGFGKDGYPRFQSCANGWVKVYKTFAGAVKQLERIQNTRVSFTDTAAYGIERINGIFPNVLT